jgi:hypothetical protein
LDAASRGVHGDLARIAGRVWRVELQLKRPSNYESSSGADPANRFGHIAATCARRGKQSDQRWANKAQQLFGKSFAG